MIEIRSPTAEDVGLIDRKLPLDRLDQSGGEWLIAWDGGEPVGHAHLDWRTDPPALQNVYVADAHRRRGIASRLSTAAEELVRARGHPRIALDVDAENAAARALYERLGYREVGTPPRRAYGTILLRGKPFSFDVMLIDLVKSLDRPVDFRGSRSS